MTLGAREDNHGLTDESANDAGEFRRIIMVSQMSLLMTLRS